MKLLIIIGHFMGDVIEKNNKKMLFMRHYSVIIRQLYFYSALDLEKNTHFVHVGNSRTHELTNSHSICSLIFTIACYIFTIEYIDFIIFQPSARRRSRLFAIFTSSGCLYIYISNQIIRRIYILLQ